MITRVFAVGLLAGLCAGLIVALLQAFTTTPLIIDAERFEGGHSHQHASVMHEAPFGGAKLYLAHATSGADGDGHSEWAPEDGLERTVYTGVATIGTATGFAFILIAAMLLGGERITQNTALGWGAAAFAAAGLAPAMGLAPELPGMMAEDLFARQQWWVMTAAMSAVGLWLLLRGETGWLRLLAIPVLLAPHLWGAPHPAIEAGASAVPAELAARFAAMSLAVQAVLWALTGFLVGTFWQRIGAASEAEADGR
ncbi:CbtA family protein [Hyphomicrobium sulfonivorans]|uniref:CbtA family protein n=1 Tax=Hyphomicrobium sulfonivorans TaxID=121290 RepID=UPI00156D4FBE|nr:CbtA family protein [Hyphomicrobium sulfonivorans]MBI1650906.1 CbtA family protein [Hyphomicrobium sulfonivorans]NSL72711.1 cobalt transporter [Hyphomicrobium sulfonivorans]